jgi:hypothetical protein
VESDLVRSSESAHEAMHKRCKRVSAIRVSAVRLEHLHLTQDLLHRRPGRPVVTTSMKAR